MEEIQIEKQVNLITSVFFSYSLKYRRSCKEHDGFSENQRPASLLSPGGRERLYCFPLFAHGQLITTSVTSHSNRSKLSLAWLV